MFSKTIVVLLCVLSVAYGLKSILTAEADADKVSMMPGGDAIKQSFGFSGYLAVNGSEGLSKQQHYWFVESQDGNDNAPVAFWTNGGPGCSGLLGAFTEQGPFLTKSADGTLTENPYAWNKNVHMVFIEQPCGVGFSYSTATDTKEDYTANDASAALDNYNLIQAFMVRFPSLAKNALYLTSESYGGHYLPTLSKVIVDKNSAAQDPVLNFKGFAVGNPATTSYSITPAMLDTYWGHQIIPKPLWDKWTSTCGSFGTKAKNAEECETMFLEIYAKVSDINPYAMDFPACLSDSEDASPVWRGQSAALLRHSLGHFQESSLKTLGLADDVDYEPCADDYLGAYLNRADVKEALHVKADIKWSDCSREISYAHGEVYEDMTTYYKYLLEGNDKYKLDILVYSGDDDAVCATIGTQDWIYGLGYAPAKGNDWRAWKTEDGQLAGYLTKFSGARLAFATIHGAGHEVPTYKPDAALQMFTEYIAGSLTSESE